MKSTPLIINWHHENAPIYSAHFEPHGKGRLATAGGDNNVRIWKVENSGEDRKVEYLSTLGKHTQAVNVVRWAPKGEVLASAGDDGNVILWVPSEAHYVPIENEGLDDKETWRAKHMCRSSGAEIYDLAWSPDAAFFMIGSMDNVARIYNASTGTLVRQIAEHSHYVQGVAWDPLNEYVATQSSDRSVHIYSLKTKDGQYTLHSHDVPTTKIASHARMDLPPRRISSNSPAPPELGYRAQLASSSSMTSTTPLTASIETPGASVGIGSPVPSAPATPTSMSHPMNPPSVNVISHSRRSSFSSRRSASPAPSLPLPAVMPMDSPKPCSGVVPMGVKNANLYANETLTSFFRRLTFTPDGSLLLTPAGQFQMQHQSEGASRTSWDVINTVYIYTRGGINRPPLAHLPGLKKPAIAIKCSPILYTIRQASVNTKHITIDTSSSEDPIPQLPEPLSKPTSAASNVMDPPSLPPTSTSAAALDLDKSSTPVGDESTKSVFVLPYRVIYAVATQDSVLLYDTQQLVPICVVSNLHLATFTDLAWSNDGLTLLISSSDGFCSTLSFSENELGVPYKGEITGLKGAASTPGPVPSTQHTPSAVSGTFAPPSPYPGFSHQPRNSSNSITAPSPPAHSSANTSFAVGRPSSPARSNSASSIATQASAAVMNNPTLIGGSVPGIAATNSGKVTGIPMTTPPETPRNGNTTPAVAAGVPAPAAANIPAPTTGTKREAGDDDKNEDAASGNGAKKRRIAPTLLSAFGNSPAGEGPSAPGA